MKLLHLLLCIGVGLVVSYLDQSLKADVVINEFMASNGATIADEDGMNEDWIELYNSGSEAIALAGWGLSDNPGDPFKWTFPANLNIGPGEYLLVWASGKDRSGVAGIAESPDQFPGLVLWLRASDLVLSEGQSVPGWIDQSGLENHAVQPDTLQQPLFLSDAGNGMPALGFNRSAAQQFLLPTSEFSGMDDFSNFSILQVIRWTGGVRSGLWGGYRGNNMANNGSSHFEISDSGGSLRLRLPPDIDFTAYQAVTLNKWHVVGAFMDQTSGLARLAVDGNQLAEKSGNVGLTLFSNYAKVQVGSSEDNVRCFGGEIAEIILFNRSLDPEEYQAINNYLALTYDMPKAPSNLRPHTSFRISAQGEPLQLTRPDGTVADLVAAVELPTDVSYGRDPLDSTVWAYFYQPTPESSNLSPAFQQLIGRVLFSVPSGVYTDPFDLELVYPDSEVTILYTTDGSEPEINAIGGRTYQYKNSYNFGQLLTNSIQTHYYSGPLSISDRSSDPNKISMITTTPESNPRYLPSFPIKKGSIIRARAFVSGAVGEVTTATYFVSNTGAFNYSIPIVSLSLNEDSLFDFIDGIFVPGVDRVTSTGGRICSWGNYHRRGSETERAGHFQYFVNHQPVIDQPIGLRIQGNCSRERAFKSVRLYARGSGEEENMFKYPFLKDPVPGAVFPQNDRYHRLILRTPNYLDVVFSRLYQPVYEGVGGRVQPAIQFINGEYWGLCYVRDRFDTYHLSNHYGLNPDNITIIDIRYRHEVENINFNVFDRVYNLSSGIPSDMDDYMAMRTFISQSNMMDPVVYQQAEQMLCINSFIDHLILKIFAGDDHYAPEFVFWRARDPENSGFGDGRWRVYVKDFDSTLFTNNFLTGLATGTLPRSFGFEMFSNLLNNHDFQNRFINRFADLINTHFRTERFHQIINESYDEVSPYWSEVRSRWNNVAISNPDRPFTPIVRDNLLTFSSQQPNRQRSYIRQHFGIASEHTITIDVSNSSHGSVRVNSLLLDEHSVGSNEIFPWSGIYFDGIPVSLAAVPSAGQRFVEWTVTPADGVAYSSNSESISLTLTDSYLVEAVFEPIPLEALPVALHVWDFEDSINFLNPSQTIGGATLTHIPAETIDILRNTAAQDFSTAHLRVNNPLGKELLFQVPTTGFEAITVRFLTRRSGQGAAQQTLSYSVDGATWVDFSSYSIFDSGPQLREFDLSGVSGSANNPQFALKITFQQISGGATGNNRFDDFAIHGTALAGVNLPPVISVEADGLVESAVGRILSIDLNDWFTDPNGDTLSFSVHADNEAVIVAELNESTLLLDALSPGEARVTIIANDGSLSSAPHLLRVLVYGEPPVDMPIFLPPDSGLWTQHSNWSTLNFPNGVGATARFLPSVSVNRNIDLTESITVGHIRLDLGESPFRTRFRGVQEGRMLTFDGGDSEAVIEVNGSGVGFVEFEIENRVEVTGYLRLMINHMSGSPEHGALRLREEWSGSGSLIKDGPGIATMTGENKLFSGALAVDRGVLAITAPAVPAWVSGTSVSEGGQLRLISASSETEPVRLYSFGGTLELAGLGWSDGPEQVGAGVRGALRYDPGSQENSAEVTNPLHIAFDAGIHIDGSRNQLIISGPVTGNSLVLKSGGGVLTLSGESPDYNGELVVENGALNLLSHLSVPVWLSESALLRGTGTVGYLSGSGTVLVEQEVLTASNMDSPAIAAIFAVHGASGNGVLRLTAPEAFIMSPSALDLLVQLDELNPGDRARGGIFVPSGINLAELLMFTPIRLLVEDDAGSFVFNGTAYRLSAPADALEWRVVEETVQFNDGQVTGQWIEVLRKGTASTYSQWLGLQVPEAAVREDPLLASPEADPTGSGVSNLIRYALGIGFSEFPFNRMPVLIKDGMETYYTFPFNPALNDLRYQVQVSPDLSDWNNILFDSVEDMIPPVIDGWLTLPLESGDSNFMRLKIQKQ